MTTPRSDLPSGTVTFLFSDVEGSTRLLAELGAEAYAEALAEHRRIVREAIASRGGVEVDTSGDAFFVAFTSATVALEAAAVVLDELAGGPIRLRMGLHTGTPLLAAEGYIGQDVHVAARVAASAHGGQVVLTQATRELLGDRFPLSDLGEHRLKDIAGPVSILQLGSEPFPPLRTISNTNLPRPTSTFVGRERELDDVQAMLRDGARLVTLTGPGGTGKTRLAIEAAAGLIPDMKAGVFWVGLSTLTDPEQVPGSVATTLGARGDLAEHIGEREILLVLDNLEQVVAAAPQLATLVEVCPNMRVLVTSRERLRVRGEAEYAVPPLAAPEAVELFVARTGLEADATIGELCRRLDSLPLAIELAAARTAILSPAQILERIGDRLDLLKGGRDAESRQSTLRTTIAWSHDLLSDRERLLFARLSIFRGGWSLDAAEAICGADLDTLQSLVDKSLVRREGERFAMLETIAEYARERLDASDEGDAVRRRHANHYLELATRMDAELRRGEPEEGPVSVLESEIDNLRAATDWLLATGDIEGVRAITVSLPMYWEMRGLYGEGRRWLDRAVALDLPDDDTRRRLLLNLARFAYAQGDHPAAVAASDEAAVLSARLGGAIGPLDALRDQAFAAWDHQDWAEAERLFRERLALATRVDNGVAMSACRLNLAAIANRTSRHDLAFELLTENLAFVRSRGQTRCEANTLMGFAETAVRRGQAEDGAPMALDGARLSLVIRDGPTAADCLDLWAVGAAKGGDATGAATILGATEAARESMGAQPDEDESAVRTAALALIEGPAERIEPAWMGGRALDLEAALERASSDGP